MKRILVLTSGGDAPGLNMAITSVVRESEKSGIECLGSINATNGLSEDDGKIVRLASKNLEKYIPIAGSVLGSLSKGRTITEPMLDNFKRRIKELGIEGIIAFGGDGSAKTILRYMHETGAKVPLVMVPKTIDNDVPAVESSIGYDSAINFMAQNINGLSAHANSLNRVVVCETMGRASRTLAEGAAIRASQKINSADAAQKNCLETGADIVLSGERSYDIDTLYSALAIRHEKGQSGFVIVVAENTLDVHNNPISVSTRPDQTCDFTGAGQYIAQLLQTNEKLQSVLGNRDIRVVNPAQLQRGTPFVSEFDLTLAEKAGTAAVEILMQGGNRFITYTGYGFLGQQPEISSITLDQLGTLLAENVSVMDKNDPFKKLLNGYGISVGDEGPDLVRHIYTKAIKAGHLNPSRKNDFPEIGMINRSHLKAVA